MLSLCEIIKGYRLNNIDTQVLERLNLSLGSGTVCCIIGKSGSGKTTLLNLIGLLDLPDHGSVLVDGQDVGQLSQKALSVFRRRTIGFVFQNYQLLPHLSVLDNVALPLLYNHVGRHAARAAARRLLTALDIGDLGARLPKQLSGGQQQRVAIARALANDPAIILADEPTGNLDGETAAMVMTLLCRINRQHGTTIIIVTHDPGVAAHADQTYRLEHGRLHRIDQPAAPCG